MPKANGGKNGRSGPRRFRRDAPQGTRAWVAGASGRAFVVAALLGLAITWAGVYLAFRGWRARHRELAEYGRTRVATAVDPLAGIEPPGVPRAEWRRAVADTRGMLAGVTAAGLLDRAGMDTLRADVAARVAGAQARPESAVGVLARIWHDRATQAGPVVGRAPRRAAFLAEATALAPLAGVVPEGEDPGAWRRAVADTQARMIELAARRRLDPGRSEALRAGLAGRVETLRPATARGALAWLRAELEREAGGRGARE